jgi:exodeoxyribonuclease VII large subunit
MANTYLDVPFSEKDKVKALGGRWDASAKQWYVPAGYDVAIFRAWLPGPLEIPDRTSSTALIAPSPVELLASPRGVSLSELLAGVAQAVASAYREGTWTRVEVLNASNKNGNVYLELSERDDQGRVLAKALGTIWSRTAERILADFEHDTGASLAPGIKLLVLARPIFKPQFGFSVDITGVDPSYTIGDLEAQKRKIREELLAEQLFDRNKKLPAPWDFNRVLVVSPENAAGLGDFVAEADRLRSHGLCEFVYAHSRFQGQGAAGEVLEALKAALTSSAGPLPDAIVIIRGGGAVNDLAWLNDYDLARFICECEVPVLTGIGHERDSTILDEVAFRSFDTPSKVAAAIEGQILRRANAVREAYDSILTLTSRRLDQRRIDVDGLNADVQANARETVHLARRSVESHLSQAKADALEALHTADGVARERIRDVQELAKQSIERCRHLVPAKMSMVREMALWGLRAARSEMESHLAAEFERARVAVNRTRESLTTTLGVTLERATHIVGSAKQSAEGLAREVAGQGPQKTLSRGFAVVQGPNGKSITHAQTAVASGDVSIVFADGTVTATVREIAPRLKEL